MNSLKKILLSFFIYYESSTCIISMEDVKEKGGLPHKSDIKSQNENTQNKNIIIKEIETIKRYRDSLIAVIKKNEDSVQRDSNFEDNLYINEYNNRIHALEGLLSSTTPSDSEKEIRRKIKDIKDQYHPEYNNSM